MLPGEWRVHILLSDTLSLLFGVRICISLHMKSDIIMDMTFTDIVHQLDETKKRIESLQAKLVEEQDKAKTLFEEFQSAQAEMAQTIGVSLVLPARTRKSRGKRSLTAEGRLNIQVGAMLRKWKREHPNATEKQVSAHREKLLAGMKGA